MQEIVLKTAPGLAGLRLSEAGWVGVLCSCTQKQSDGFCRDHHLPMQRMPKGEPVNQVTREQMAQFTPVQDCWNATLNFDTGKYDTHKLETVKVPVVDPVNKEWFEEERCKTCKTTYTYSKGRAAAEQELADFKAGKIQRKTPKAQGHD